MKLKPLNCSHWHNEKIHLYLFILKLICRPSHYWASLDELQYHKTQNQTIRPLTILSPKINKKLDKKESICNREEVGLSPNLLTISKMEAPSHLAEPGFCVLSESQEMGAHFILRCTMFPRTGTTAEKVLLLDLTSWISLANGVHKMPLLPEWVGLCQSHWTQFLR